jgi:adenylate cyclase class IV
MEILDIQEIDLSAFDDSEEVKQAKGTLKDIKETRAKAMKKMKEEQSASFYFTVVCRDQEQRKKILHALRTPEYEDFIDGTFLEQVLKSHKGDDHG